MTKYWRSDGGSPLRQYSACGPPYHVSPDRHRYQPEGLRRSTRSYVLPVHEPQLPDSDQEAEREAKEARRRIPVACGRCRKRKIRCSGPQHEGACVNCKNAGNSECQFNRVSSEEMALHSSIDFGYNTDLARAVHVRGTSQANSYRPPSPNYSYGPVEIPTNLPLSYRAHPASEYQYEAKSAYLLPPFNADYHDDGLDFSLSASGYPQYGPEVVGGLSSYSSYGAGRGWIPSTSSSRGSVNSICYGSNIAQYGPSQTQFNGSAYGFRSSINNELNSFSFSDMTSSLPSSETSATHNRTLPIPPNRNVSALIPLNRLANDLSYNNNGMNSSGSAGTQLVVSGNSASMSYLSQSGNEDSVENYNCSGLSGGLNHQQHDVYDAGNNWASAPLTADPALRSQNLPSDLYYDCNDIGGKASQAGQRSVNSNLAASHSSSPDLYSYNSSEVSRKASQSGQSSQSSLNSVVVNENTSSSSDIYYSHCGDNSRKVSQNKGSNAIGNLMTGQSCSIPYGQEKSFIPRSSSMTSMDTARTARHRPP